jgi:hypothetical protein
VAAEDGIHVVADEVLDAGVLVAEMTGAAEVDAVATAVAHAVLVAELHAAELHGAELHPEPSLKRRPASARAAKI